MPRASHAILRSGANFRGWHRIRLLGERAWRLSPDDQRHFLVVVMLETLESIINADEIANTFGLDVVIQGNSDLTNFSGWSQTDARYDALLTISHNAALKAGKYWGNAGQQVPTGHPLSPATRFVQNGPSHDGFAFPARGRGAAEHRSRRAACVEARSRLELAVVADAAVGEAADPNNLVDG